VEQVEITTPMLLICSDRRRLILARLGENKQLESAIFSDDQEVIRLISLLLIHRKKRALLRSLHI
jgi:hypothetical protein